MRTIRFGRTNVEVPAISLGTWGHGGERTSEGNAVGWSGHDDTKAKDALVLAWRKGITHWDTADAYGDGHAEELIGEVLASGVPRNEIFLASKFGWIKGPSDHWYDPQFMREQCERSLRNMRTDVIDLYYFHHCMFGDRDEYFDDALAMMHTLRDEGKVRFIGLSDWDASRIMKFIDRVDPDVVQPYRNLVDDHYEPSGLKAYADAHDLGVAFFSPLKHGLLLGKYTEPQT
ncbi:MAG TPA: aldo/keto reductase, partial [Thermoanaerobaculia bacterium]